MYASDNIPIHENRGISCVGTEDSLGDCPREPHSFTCGHYDDVAVTCIPTNSSLLPSKHHKARPSRLDP